MKYLCGIDGYRKGWIAAVKEPGNRRVIWRKFGKMQEILPEIGEFMAIGIDIPIGLQREGRRQCDVSAKKFIGTRGNSVFDAPIIPVLEASDYLSACSIREQIENKRMSQQAWGIVKKVREIDTLIQASAQFSAVVYEVHPEVTFCLMNDNRPMEFYKKSKEGFEERVNLLTRYFDVNEDFIIRSRRGQGVPKDDLIDALSALWSAERIFRGKHQVFPAFAKNVKKNFCIING